MTACAYCEEQATAIIPSNPEHVCVQHALEFWTGLLVYARDRRRDHCVKDEQLCTCWSCEELKAGYQRPVLTEAADRSHAHHERQAIRLAS